MTDEKVLIRRIMTGDQEAFADLIALHEKQVYNLCLRMTGHREDAQDLTQEAFLKAWRGMQFYKFESSFSTWLYRLTTNVCIDHLRKQKRNEAVSLTVTDENGEDGEFEIPASDLPPEERVLQKEQQNTVEAAMQELDEEFRVALTLRVVNELSYEEIGEILDLKPGTVKSRIARARMKLKKILTKNGNLSDFGSSNHNREGDEP